MGVCRARKKGDGEVGRRVSEGAETNEERKGGKLSNMQIRNELFKSRGEILLYI